MASLTLFSLSEPYKYTIHTLCLITECVCVYARVCMKRIKKVWLLDEFKKKRKIRGVNM